MQQVEREECALRARKEHLPGTNLQRYGLFLAKALCWLRWNQRSLEKGGCADRYGDLSSFILSLGDLLLPASTEEMQCFQTGLTYIINTNQNIKIIPKLLKAGQYQVWLSVFPSFNKTFQDSPITGTFGHFLNPRFENQFLSLSNKWIFIYCMSFIIFSKKFIGFTMSLFIEFLDPVFLL